MKVHSNTHSTSFSSGNRTEQRSMRKGSTFIWCSIYLSLHLYACKNEICKKLNLKMPHMPKANIYISVCMRSCIFANKHGWNLKCWNILPSILVFVLSFFCRHRYLLIWLNILLMLMELALYGYLMLSRHAASSTLWSSTKLQQVSFMGKCKKYRKRRPLLFIPDHHMVSMSAYVYACPCLHIAS